jgi:hypothetical protein
LPLLYRCCYLFKATFQRNLLPHFSGYKWLLKLRNVISRKTTFWILTIVRTKNLSENVLRHPCPRADLLPVRKLISCTFRIYSFRFSYLLLRFCGNYRNCVYEVRVAALVAPIISL